jgi:N-acetylglutamate synthase-like GNAT family acetyltransferase
LTFPRSRRDPAIRPLSPEDATRCDAIIVSLPYFFGDPQGIADCATAVRTQRGFVATVDGAVQAFITLEQQDPLSAEITWLAVHADKRRRGLGRLLVERATADLAASGVRAMFVLTLGASAPEPGVDDGYEGTRTFYRRLGFIPLRDFALRTWNDAAALILVRPLSA